MCHTYKIGFDEADGGLRINSLSPLGRGFLQLLDLLKVLLHTSKLLEDGVLSCVYSLKAQGSWAEGVSEIGPAEVWGTRIVLQNRAFSMA